MDLERQPVPSVDFPATFEQLDARFVIEEAYPRYLAQLRWADGFVCPHCGAQSAAWMTSRGLWHCRVWQGKTSVAAGTVFDGTRTPLRTCFLTMRFVMSPKQGANGLGLQGVVALRSYHTARA